jgi:hypothetical protein
MQITMLNEKRGGVMQIVIETLEDSANFRITEDGYVKENKQRGGVYFSIEEIVDILGHKRYYLLCHGNNKFNIAFNARYFDK